MAKKGDKNGKSILSIFVCLCVYVCIYFAAMLACYACISVVAFILQLFQVCVDVGIDIAASLCWCWEFIFLFLLILCMFPADVH